MKLERLVLKPTLTLYTAYTVTGEEDIELLNETKQDEEGTEVKIIQNINGLKVTTKTELKYVSRSTGIEYPITEESKVTIEVPVGTKLIYSEGKGYVVSERALCTPDQAIKDYEIIKGAMTVDSSGD